MSPLELVAILALVGYSVYKQTQVAEVSAKGRFKMAIIYGIVGLSIGGFAAPHGAAAVGLLGLSAILSVIVGMARGRLTKIWLQPDGRIFRQGTAVTVGLFLAMVATKFLLGTVAYIDHVHDGGGFGEIMVMIAIMMAVQAEIVWHRAQSLQASARSVALSV